ncbi:MAG: cobalamin-binding protein [Candidatus Eisenbacteria bacterium]|nr:cobalamin-binding protein [Candidatus Eisenbacteria bacterium]
MELLEQIAKELESGDDKAVGSLTRSALEQKTEASIILNEGLIAGMQVVGDRFRDHEIFLPDVLLAARAMNAGLALLEPLLAESDTPARGKVVIGTVKGDLHDIGKNLVGIMLNGAGFEVIDLGKDVAPREFVETARETGARVIGMSALLTTTMPSMKEVVSLLKSEGLNGTVRTIVGGAPVTEEYARDIGADAYGFDAANAVERVRELTN